MHFRLGLVFGVAILVSLNSLLSIVSAQSSKLNIDWELGPTGSTASFRGVSSPSDQPDVVWLCGSKSTVIRSSDGGSSWQDVSPNYKELEFRSIHAFSAQRAVIASAGTPAVILLTEDGGKNWQEVYRNDAKTAFFDSMQFWNGTQGIVVSDPVDGSFLLVETKDSGRTWTALPKESSPVAEPGEACFAASNSAILLGDNGAIWIGTGGSEKGIARVLQRTNASASWQAHASPLPSNASSGIFSLTHWMNPKTAKHCIIVVGGDYRPGEKSSVTVAISEDRGKSWKTSVRQPAQFRSAVAVVPINSGPKNSTDNSAQLSQAAQSRQAAQLIVAVGPEGSDYSLDGETWTSFSNHGFHALCRSGDRLYATGSSGRFARLKLQ